MSVWKPITAVVVGVSAVGFIALMKHVGAPAQLESACESGRTEYEISRCAELGGMYARGFGVQKDDARALRLYQRACEGGSMWGCGELGFFHAHGTAVPVDYARALELFERSCGGHSMYGCNGLAELYRDGHGVPMDVPRALALFEEVCKDSTMRVRGPNRSGHEYGCDNLHELQAKAGKGTGR